GGGPAAPWNALGLPLKTKSEKPVVTANATDASGIRQHPMRGLLALEIGALWRAFWAEHASFWAICAYLLIEYVRPQSIIRSLDILPWAQLAILMSAGMWVLDPRKRWVRDP